MRDSPDWYPPEEEQDTQDAMRAASGMTVNGIYGIDGRVLWTATTWIPITNS